MGTCFKGRTPAAQVLAVEEQLPTLRDFLFREIIEIQVLHRAIIPGAGVHLAAGLDTNVAPAHLFAGILRFVYRVYLQCDKPFFHQRA